MNCLPTPLNEDPEEYGEDEVRETLLVDRVAGLLETSRTRARRMIQAGKIAVDGEIVRSPDEKILGSSVVGIVSNED